MSKPRNVKPSSRWTTAVFSGASRSPIGARTAATSSRRTVRKPLGLHGSHRPAIGFEAEAPVSEQSRVALGGAGQEFPCSSFASAQPFVLPAGPAHQMLVDAPQEGIQHRLVEAAVIVDPPLHNAVEHLCQVG